MTPNLEISREGRVLRLTLNRPEKRNAINLELCEALVEAVEWAEHDPGVGAILIDSAGRAFCSGMDLDEALEFRGSGLQLHERLFTLGARIRKPIVAAINGPALAGGTGLVANAHVAIAAQGSQFGLTEIRIGMWPYVVMRAVSAAVGQRRALELSLTGRVFGTQEAMVYGLIHEVAPAFELEDRAMAVATNLAGFSTDVVRRGMYFHYTSQHLSPSEAGQLAVELRMQNFESADFAEGVTALKEKRRPDWPSMRSEMPEPDEVPQLLE